MLEDFTRLNEVFGINEPMFLPKEENIEYICEYTSPMLGKKHSEETKRLMSEARKRSYENPELRELTRQRAIGRKHTEESKEKMSKRARARDVSEACRIASAKASRKEWTIQHPCGRIETVHGARQFCFKHNLNYNTFKNVMKGNQKQHKGYRVL